jgi:hypothetical protein
VKTPFGVREAQPAECAGEGQAKHHGQRTEDSGQQGVMLAQQVPDGAERGAEADEHDGHAEDEQHTAAALGTRD